MAALDCGRDAMGSDAIKLSMDKVSFLKEAASDPHILQLSRWLWRPLRITVETVQQPLWRPLRITVETVQQPGAVAKQRKLIATLTGIVWQHASQCVISPWKQTAHRPVSALVPGFRKTAHCFRLRSHPCLSPAGTLYMC